MSAVRRPSGAAAAPPARGSQAPEPGLAEQLAVAHDHLAAAHHRHGPARDGAAGVGRVAGAVVHHGCRRASPAAWGPTARCRHRRRWRSSPCSDAGCRSWPAPSPSARRTSAGRAGPSIPWRRTARGSRASMPGMPLAICLKVGLGPADQLAGLVEGIGRVIGGDRPAGRRAPAPARSPPGRLRVRGGGEHIHLAPSMPGLVHVLAGHEQVLRAGLGEHLQARVRARPGSSADALGRRDVEDHDRLVDQLGEGDQPVEGLGLAAARMADGVELGRRCSPSRPAACPSTRSCRGSRHARTPAPCSGARPAGYRAASRRRR